MYLVIEISFFKGQSFGRVIFLLLYCCIRYQEQGAIHRNIAALIIIIDLDIDTNHARLLYDSNLPP